jgi:beta-lactamase regulating signal transducer with metallopeptidase domain
METVREICEAEIVQRLGWTLVHFVWQGFAIGLILAVVLRLLRKSSANLRYVSACAALALIVVMPAVTFRIVKVAQLQPLQTEKFLTARLRYASPRQAEDIKNAEHRTQNTEGRTQINETDVIVGDMLPTMQSLGVMIEPVLPYIVGGWLMGVFGLSLWHLGGWTQLQRLRRQMVKEVAPALKVKLQQLSNALGIQRIVGIMESALVQVPTVVGHLRPVILLPVSALTGLSTEQIEAILAHELAHIKRCDYLVNILQTVVEILGFYHPAVWWISHKIRIERENCCDDMAVSLCSDRVCYARALTTMEEIRSGPSTMLRTGPTLAVAASGGSLFDRIRRLLGKDSANEGKLSWLPSIIAILLIGALLIPTALALSSKPKPELADSRKSDFIELISVAPEDITIEQLADICEGIESAIMDVAVDYEWYREPPLEKEDITGTGILITIGPEKWHWSTARPFSDLSLTSMSADFASGTGNTFHSTVKQSYNGKIGKDLRITEWPDKHVSIEGIITKSRRFMEANPFSPGTFSIFHFGKEGPLSKIMRMGDKLEIELNKEKEIINGFETVHTVISRKAEDGRKILIYRVYFAVRQGYTPVRFEHSNGRDVVYRVDVTKLENVAKGLWYPAAGRLGATKENSSNVYKASRIIVNQGIGEDYFDLQFPQGTRVTDEINNTEFIVEPTKEQKEAFDKEQEYIKEHSDEIKAAREEGGRIYSAAMLHKLGTARDLYFTDNNKKLPQKLSDIKPYLDDANFLWLDEHITYLDVDETLDDIDPTKTPLAYDKTILENENNKGTNVLYNDCHVSFEKTETLEKLGIKTENPDGQTEDIKNAEDRTQNAEDRAQKAEEPKFIVKGTVTDAETGQPIAGAKVGDVERYAGGKQWTTTDSNGGYSYKTWYEEHDIKCEATGYKTQNKVLLTKLYSKEKEKVMDFALEPENASTGALNESQRIYAQWTEERFGNYLDRSQYADLSDSTKTELEGKWLKLLEEPENEKYYDAINGLVAIKSKKAIKPLLRIAAERVEKDNRCRWMSVRALGIIGDESVVPELIPLVYHYNQNTRFWAQISLVRLTGENFGTDWQKWAEWWNSKKGKPEYSTEKVKWTSNPDWADPEKQKKVDEETMGQLRGDKKGKTDKSGDGTSREPVVVRTTPAAYADDVSPQLKKITVTFDRPMMDQSWSWTGGGETYPKTSGKPRYNESRRMCSLPVELEAGKVYWVGINSPSHKYFQTEGHIPAKRYVILFATKGADGKATPIPEDMLAKAKEINEQPEKTDAEAEGPRPKIVSVSPPAGTEMPLISELQLVFDQPMMPDKFEIYDASMQEKYKLNSQARPVRNCAVYDVNTYKFTMPLFLPSNWNGTIKLEGFRSKSGVEIEPIEVRYSTLREPFSAELLERFETARKRGELKEVLTQIKKTRMGLNSLQEVIYTSLTLGADKKEEKIDKVTIKMQGEKQFYADMSESFEKPWIIGSDGQTCWFYNEYKDEGKLVVLDYNEIERKNISICNVFGLSEAGVEEAAALNNLEYAGTETFDGKNCHIIRGWNASVRGDRALCIVNTWLIDGETYMPMKMLQESSYGELNCRFEYERINQVFDNSEFKPESVTSIAGEPEEPLGEGYETRFITIVDGTENGRMSVRWGKQGSKGTVSSGLN